MPEVSYTANIYATVAKCSLLFMILYAVPHKQCQYAVNLPQAEELRIHNIECHAGRQNY